VYPPQFEYFSPQDLESAVALLSEHREEAKVLAGGQSLIPLLKLRLSGPRVLVDINRIASLVGFEDKGDSIVFGALCRYAEIESSSVLAEKLPILTDAASLTADVQVRNRGTMAGSLAHADPAGDWAPALLALEATVTVRGAKGERILSVEDFLKDAYTPDLNPDELLTHVTVPLPDPRASGAYLKFEKRAGDFAVASAGVQLRLDGQGRCEDVRIGVGALAATAVRSRKAEEALTGHEPDPDRIAKAAEALQGDIDPFEDIRGSVAYKRNLASVVLEKACSVALARARGERVSLPHL
jgi:aerobic carbon-monoxide dehydrogenase medium subunit